MKLEEARIILNKMKRTLDIKAPNVNTRNRDLMKFEAIETVLQALDNSIPKEKIKERIKQLEKRINYLRSEITKTIQENEKAGIESEIDINEHYIYNMEIELEELENKVKVLQELLEE